MTSWSDLTLAEYAKSFAWEDERRALLERFAQEAEDLKFEKEGLERKIIQMVPLMEHYNLCRGAHHQYRYEMLQRGLQSRASKSRK